jgi:hypothetical protein
VNELVFYLLMVPVVAWMAVNAYRAVKADLKNRQ